MKFIVEDLCGSQKDEEYQQLIEAIPEEIRRKVEQDKMSVVRKWVILNITVVLFTQVDQYRQS